MREWSPRCRAYLDHYEEKMILAPEDLALTRARLVSPVSYMNLVEYLPIVRVPARVLRLVRSEEKSLHPRGHCPHGSGLEGRVGDKAAGEW